MNTAELIYQKSKQLPEPIVIELLHYLEFLESKYYPQNVQETLSILQNPSLMAQIKASEKTFAAKTGFIPTEEQLNALARFEGDTWACYEELREKNKVLHKNLCKILKEMQRNNPESGTGKPERLCYELSGLWSRRLSDKIDLFIGLMKNGFIFLLLSGIMAINSNYSPCFSKGCHSSMEYWLRLR